MHKPKIKMLLEFEKVSILKLLLTMPTCPLINGKNYEVLC